MFYLINSCRNSVRRFIQLWLAPWAIQTGSNIAGKSSLRGMAATWEQRRWTKPLRIHGPMNFKSSSNTDRTNLRQTQIMQTDISKIGPNPNILSNKPKTHEDHLCYSYHRIGLPVVWTSYKQLYSFTLYISSETFDQVY
jgi:hypothetical protein